MLASLARTLAKHLMIELGTTSGLLRGHSAFYGSLRDSPPFSALQSCASKATFAPTSKPKLSPAQSCAPQTRRPVRLRAPRNRRRQSGPSMDARNQSHALWPPPYAPPRVVLSPCRCQRKLPCAHCWPHFGRRRRVPLVSYLLLAPTKASR